MAKALSTSEVNASMGKIVAAPTAGASGILPSAILTIAENMIRRKGYDLWSIYCSIYRRNHS